MGKISSLTDDDFRNLVSESMNITDILRKLGLCTTGGTSSRSLKKRIAELEINTDHFSSASTCNKSTFSLSEILISDSKYTNIHRLKKRLVSESVLKYECSICGNIGEWLGKPLSLQLDHINGKNNDHRIENLRFLCPNCHCQTDTYAGKNK